jgi:pyruvate,water dikinase
MSFAYPPGMSRGFGETLAPWGALIDTMNVVYVNGFAYMQPQPFDAPGPDGEKSHEYIGAEIGRRTGLAAAAFEQRIWRDVLQRWDTECKPVAIARHRELAAVDLGTLDDAALLAQLRTRIEWLTEMAYQHHRFNATAMLPIGDFILHAARWTGEAPVPMFAVYDGWSPVSGMVPPELAPAIDAVTADAEAQALLTGDTPPAERLAELCRRVPAVADYLASSGFRLAAGFDLTNPTIGERPDILLDRIRGSIGHDRDAAKLRAEHVADDLRARVPAEHRAEFDDLLAESRLVYRLRDERGIYSDAAAAGLLRLALIELGRRLFERGRISFMYDSLDLRADELEGILGDAVAPTADELSARVARRKALSAAGAPPLLGPPPPPPPPVDQLPPPLARVMSALGFYIDGVLGDVQTPVGDDNVVVGIGGSRGVYEGPARLVRNFDDLFDLQQGDVLVTTATGESFNAFLSLLGAAVTDHGSFASHAAIMGREMGFPTVVGTVDATSRIANGMLVRVDGTAGTVTIIGA